MAMRRSFFSPPPTKAGSHPFAAFGTSVVVGIFAIRSRWLKNPFPFFFVVSLIAGHTENQGDADRACGALC